MAKITRAPKTRVHNRAPRPKPRPHIDKTMIVAVVDGARAAIYIAKPSPVRQQGGRPGLRLSLVPGGRLRQSNRKSRAIVSDRPGHKAGGFGTRRYAVQPRMSPHDRAERQFVVDVAEFLGRVVPSLKPDELVLVAPPRAMGELRGRLARALARRDILEITQEWTGLGPAEIGKRLTALLMPAAS
jgi:protein required for attachment to host cells